MIIGMLGILKAGGAYVPIDPDSSGQRLEFIIHDINARLLVTSRLTSGKLPPVKDVDFVIVDTIDPSGVAEENSENLGIYPKATGAAYVIYTSGSSGKPKGVIIEHRNLLHYLVNANTRYVNRESPCTGTFLHLSFTFDASI